MANLVKEASLLLLTKECAEEYFEEFNFFHVECFKTTLSRALDYTIISGSLLVKVPQIVKILESKSAKGINILSVLLDLFVSTAMICYSFINGFPFSSWGDGLFVGVQTLAIAVLVMHFSGNTTQATAFLATYLAVLFAALSGLTPVSVIWACQAMNIPIVLASKLMQAYTNYTYRSTGQLSAATSVMLLFGSLARIFTSIHETGDMTMIIMYICCAAANAVLVFQIFYYWNVHVTKEEKPKKVQ